MFKGFRDLFGARKDGEGSRPPSRPKPAAAKPKAPPKLPRVNLARKYTIVAETGQGSMSKVYRAVDNANGRVVCLKVQDRAKTEAALARSQQVNRPSEGEVGQKIVHPNVVRTFEYGLTSKGDYFIAMEFIDGVSLTFVRETRGLSLADKVELMAQAADGLGAVHAAGFIHHDFGPKNLLVTTDGQLKLIDFGLSIPNTAAFRRPGNRTGTLNYMAPELIRREPKDERLDIFSWGATAFELLAGRLPYDINAPDPMTMIRLRMNVPPMLLEKAAPKLPEGLCAIVNQALERRPFDRWERADTLGPALRELELPART
jgi:serine/threonine protein kinase